MRRYADGRGVLAVVGALTLPAVKAGADEAVTRGCRISHVSIRNGRPVRPCLVVNPGGGRLRLGLCIATFQRKQFPLRYRAFLAGQILCACRFSTLLRPLRGATRPSPPIGSQQGRTGAVFVNKDVAFIDYAALVIDSFSVTNALGGLSQTSPVLSQFRVGPDHRSGCLAFASA